MEIKRDYYLNKLIVKQHNGLIKVVTGMRRCGKSYLLFNLFMDYLIENNVAADHIIEVAFDSFKKIIITKDTPTPTYNEAGILVMNVYDFLLNGNSLEQ